MPCFHNVRGAPANVRRPDGLLLAEKDEHADGQGGILRPKRFYAVLRS
jgi:hypothetical protein